MSAGHGLRRLELARGAFPETGLEVAHLRVRQHFGAQELVQRLGLDDDDPRQPGVQRAGEGTGQVDRAGRCLRAVDQNQDVSHRRFLKHGRPPCPISLPLSVAA